MSFVLLSWDASTPAGVADEAVEEALSAANAGRPERVQRRVVIIDQVSPNLLASRMADAVDRTPSLVRFWMMICKDGSKCVARLHASTDVDLAREIVSGGGYPREV